MSKEEELRAVLAAGDALRQSARRRSGAGRAAAAGAGGAHLEIAGDCGR